LISPGRARPLPGRAQFRRLRAGRTLVQQGQPREELFLLFDGVLQVEIDGKPVTQVGPGAILGEMALLHDGRRTATLRAVTRAGSRSSRRTASTGRRWRKSPQAARPSQTDKRIPEAGQPSGGPLRRH